jgi:hypothetical protein
VAEDERLNIWEGLFERALVLIDDARKQGLPVDEWTFGGGTVLMRRHRHRLSKDIDIFIDNPEFLGYLNPRLSNVAESLTTDYVEDTEYIKLRFPDGEIDFVVAAPLSQHPANLETVVGRPFLVETSTEIVAKKIWHRGQQFTARDILDLAMVAEREPEALTEIFPILRGKRDVVLKRIADFGPQLRETFNELLVLEYRRSFEECVEIVKSTLSNASSTVPKA